MWASNQQIFGFFRLALAVEISVLKYDWGRELWKRTIETILAGVQGEQARSAQLPTYVQVIAPSKCL